MIKASDLIEDIWARYNSVYNNAGLFEECETKMAEKVLIDVQAAIEYFDKKDKYRWHDLRKNPDDLPNVANENDLYLVYDELGFAQYRTVRGWTFKDKFKKFDAWRAIEPLEET